ncbi:MAG: hypothetical protein RI953_1418 [Pseudomonadota bacterium]|jgi:hypothetical protein
MNAPAQESIEQTQGSIPRWLLPVREIIFGKQNERIEYFMDSYFKLPSEGRTAVVAGAFIVAGLTVFGFIGLYLSALSSLQSKLDQSFQAVNKLRAKQVEYAVTKRKFDELDKRISNVTSSLQILSLLEEKAKSLDLQISGNTKTDKASSEKDFIKGTLLAEKYKSTRSEFRVSNVSLKKIIDFVVAIESDDKMLRVSDLRIKGLYQNKIYFDATFAIDGIEPKK